MTIPMTEAGEAQVVADVQANGAKIEAFAKAAFDKQAAGGPQPVEFDRGGRGWLRADGSPAKERDFPKTNPVSFDPIDAKNQNEAGVARDLMLLGISPGAINEAINGGKVTALEHAQAEAWMKRAIANKEFCANLMAKQAKEMREWTLANIILASEVVEAA